MQDLNFKKYDFRYKKVNEILQIFDCIRKKFVVLTPEEWVRQHTIQFLILDKNFPISLINVEKNIKINTLNKRYDIIVNQTNGNIFLVIECKAASVEINQNTFDQIARYNLVLKAKYLMVTNGINHYFCKIDFENEKYIFLKDIPNYNQIHK